ncbi:DUF2076 domain-containing protein [Buchnera aphidicola]|nr:DUF2076 domain-containing protein [Buchnera aphidicola]WAI03120.1 MAG: DUF2076 domain-containing protein [Buchnera aphidicola (Myzus persicae)]
MKDEEKNLIENLFNRLKNAELNCSGRDHSADELIQELVKRQPASSYYMAQTILVQETHIKKMSLKIEELKKKIEILNKEESNKKPSFLSSFFKKNPINETISPDNNIWKNKENISPTSNSHATFSTSPMTQTIPTVSKNSGFLSNALQTATGVAGGMILGNMLMNVFNHSKSEEETFDTINKSSLDHHTDEHLPNSSSYHNNLVNYEEKESDINTSQSNLDVIHHTNDEVHNIDNLDDGDINDDNFI